MSDDRSGNLLRLEKSPYLLQHADNPVHWRPWSDAAFADAREQDKPVFISIGYATCHWCHVMAHESFEDAEIAAYLNEHYICIKVDREERPDVDGIYMDVCQAMTGHGGWPLTIFTDAERRPFFAGTYFPPRARANRIGFLELIQRVHHAWSTDREQVMTSASEIIKTLEEGAATSFRGEVPEEIFTTVGEHHRRTFDDTYGGFNAQPKFPSPHHLLLLFRIARTTGDTELIRMATVTLDAMRAGGIYDHVGFGFHRYSTDREWVVPHFEKMLYDQAMLMMAYTEAWQITGRDVYRQTILDMHTWLRREMLTPEGGFASAQDADSEGVEGKYYVWSYDELAELVGDDITFLTSHFHVRREGNFNDEATGNATGLNILFTDRDAAVLTSDSERAQWEEIRERLLAARVQRVAPLTDDKVLTDWSGLMIGALARAGRALSDNDLLNTAADVYQAVSTLCGGESWVHRYRDGERAIAAMLDDHAMFGWAALELYQSIGEDHYLIDAQWHADRIMDAFTSTDGTLSSVDDTVSDLPVRQRDGFDSAYPCGNSMAAWLFADLGTILGNEAYLSRARECVVTYGTQLQRFGPGFCMLLCTWDKLLGESSEVAFKGPRDSVFLQEARAVLCSSFQPGAVYVSQPAPADPAGLRQVYPFEAIAAHEAVMICTDRACQRPLTTIEDVQAAVQEGAG